MAYPITRAAGGMIYHANEFSFNIPETFKDKTLHVFALTDEDPSEFNLVVSRGPLATDETLQSYAKLQVEQFKKSLADFQLLREGEQTVGDNRPAIFLDFTWSSNGKPVNQRQISFVWLNSPNEQQTVVMLTGTCKDRFTPEWTQTFDAIVASIQPR